MNENEHDTEVENGHKPIPSDELHPPQLISAHHGTRQFSMAALVERIISQFVREHGDNSPALVEAVTKADRLKLLRDWAARRAG